MKEKEQTNPISGATCFSTHAKFAVECNKKVCPNWIQHKDCQNCVLIAAQDGPHTLQEIGKIYNLTRMRICQIEKTIRDKIKHAC
jgi:hypothetical protein